MEIAVLDCMGFLRHFLHLFHRLRTEFLDAYQDLVLSQPESAVNQALKEAFLALRKAAEAVCKLRHLIGTDFAQNRRRA